MEAVRKATVTRGDVGEVADFASKIEEVAGVGCLALNVFEVVDAEGVEADGEDTLHGARAGADCVEVARGHKGPTAGKLGVKARNCEGAGGARVRVRDVG